MIPRLYDFSETAFTSNGLGYMTDILSCKVTEGRNGECLLEAEYPTNGIRANYICELRFIYAPYDDTNVPQPFVIYKVSRMLRTIKIYAKHVGMITNSLYVYGTMDSAKTVRAIFSGLKDNIIGFKSSGSYLYPAYANVLTFESNITESVQTDIKNPLSVREYIQGADGSIADHLGYGEIKYDGWKVGFYTARGSNTGITFRYGLNISSITGTTSSREAYTGAVIYSTFNETYNAKAYNWKSDATSPVGILPNFKLVDLTPKMKESTVFGTRADSRNSAERKNTPWILQNNITLTGYELSHTAEYEGKIPLRHIGLCDTAKVIYQPLGISSSVKVVGITWDVLKEQYASLTFGTTKKNLNGTLRAMMQKTASDMR